MAGDACSSAAAPSCPPCGAIPVTIAAETAEPAANKSWIPLVFLAVWLVMLFYMFAELCKEKRRFLRKSLNNRAKFSTYIKYRLGHWYSWTGSSSAIVLFGLSIMLLAVGGLLHSFLASTSVSDSLWNSWIWIVAPDGGNSAEPGGHVVGMLVSIGGMLIFALLVSIITSAFEEQLQKLKQGAIPVVEGGHVVILGWKPMALDIVEEICIAAEARGGEVILLLTPLPKPIVEEMFQDGKVNLRNSTVVVRTGNGHCKDDLQHAAVPEARVVLVLSQLNSSREEADSCTLRVLLTLSSHRWPIASEAFVVTECCLIRNVRLFHSLATGHMEVLAIEDFVGELMVEASRHPGLTAIINQTFGFEGDEFYLADVEGLSGCTFCDLLFAFPQASTVGIVHSDERGVQLAPPMDYVLQGDERLVLLAEDATTVPTRLPEGDMTQARSRHKLASSILDGTSRSMPSETKQEELILILGWNESAGSMLMALDQLVTAGSKVIIYSPRLIEERQEWLEAAQKRANYWFQNLDVSHLAGSLGARYKLDDLPLEKAARIFILAESSASTPDAADGQTIAAVLQLRDILSERRAGNSQVIMPQILGKETEMDIRASGLTDCIDTTKLSARIMASVCETPELSAVFAEILSETGARFNIRRLSDFISSSVPDEGVCFNEVLAAAASSGEIAIGWRRGSIKDERSGTWEINPKAKTVRGPWPEDALIATLAYNGKESRLVAAKPSARPKLVTSNSFRRRGSMPFGSSNSLRFGSNDSLDERSPSPESLSRHSNTWPLSDVAQLVLESIRSTSSSPSNEARDKEDTVICHPWPRAREVVQLGALETTPEVVPPSSPRPGYCRKTGNVALGLETIAATREDNSVAVSSSDDGVPRNNGNVTDTTEPSM